MTRGFRPPRPKHRGTGLPSTVEDVLHRWCDEEQRLRLHFGWGGVDDMAVHHRAGYLTARAVFAVNEAGEAEDKAEFYLRPQSNSRRQPSRYLDIDRIVRIRFARRPAEGSREELHTIHYDNVLLTGAGGGDLYRHPHYDVQHTIAYQMIDRDHFKFIREFGRNVYDALILARDTREELLRTREKVRRLGED